MELLGLSYFGILVGMFFAQIVLRWIFVIGVVLEKHWIYGESPTQRRTLLWALPIVLVLHSGPWAIFAIALVAFEILSVVHPVGWNWFFGAFVFGVALIGGLAGVGFARVKKARAMRLTKVNVA